MSSMSKKTSFLKKLFNRVERDGLRRRKMRRPEAHVEQLEKRIALAVDVVSVPQAGDDAGWLTVLADNGSDVFMKMDSTPTRRLLVSDNASFRGGGASTYFLSTTGNFDTSDPTFESVNVYNGSTVDQQVKFPNDIGYSPDFGLLPTWYSANTTQEALTFIVGSRTIDENDFIAGTINLGDADGTEVRFQSNGQNGWEVVGSNSPISVNFGELSRQAPILTITINSPALSGAGTNSVPTLDLEFDFERVDFITDRVTSRSGVIPSVVTPTSTFKLFNETTHAYVPGTLNGEVALNLGDIRGRAPVPLSFQINTRATGTDIPISFRTNRASEVQQSTRIFADFTVDDFRDENVEIKGTFNSETGELTLETTMIEAYTNQNINPPRRAVSLPVYLDNVEIGLRDLTPFDDAGDVFGTQFDNFANELTLFPGSDFTLSLIAELPNTASEISIENPLIVAANRNGGRVSLSAGVVSVDSGIRASGSFVIPSATTSLFGTAAEIVSINAPVSSPSFDIRVQDNEDTGNYTRSQFLLSQQGSFSNMTNVQALPPASLPPAGQVYLEVEDGDAFIEGTISAVEHSYVMRSRVGSEVEGPYVFTTASSVTEVQTGEINGETLTMLLANDTLGENFESYQTMVSNVNLQTSVDRLRMQAATRQDHSADFPFPYDITIRESDNLIVDAVSASSGKIDIQANGSLTFLSSVNSMGDIKLESGDDFVVSAPVSTSFGTIDIRGPQVNVANSVRIYGAGSDVLQNDISIEATNGQLVLADAVGAINGVSLNASGPNGSITGDGRVIADTIGATSTGDIIIRTDANGISARTPGVVQLDDQTAAAFEIFDSPDVTLTANGLDDVKTLANGTKGLSPALFADVTGALKIAVSAPQGSIDVLHSGTQTLEVGDGEAIAASQATGVGVMAAGGSVVIRSNSARDMLVSDAPSATSGATTVRFTTSQPLPSATSFVPSSLPGVYPTRLTTSLAMNADKSVDVLGGVKATDIQNGDLLLVKDGESLYSLVGVEQLSDSQLKMPEDFQVGVDPVVNKMIQGRSFASGTMILSYDEVTRLLQISKPLISNVHAGDTVHITDYDAQYCNGIYGVVGIAFETSNLGSGTSVVLSLRRSSSFDTTSEMAGRRYVRVTDGAMSGNGSSVGKTFVSQGFSNQKIPMGVGEKRTPLVVTPVLSKPGFVTANAISTIISTQGIPAEVNAANTEITATTNGAIGFDTGYFDGVVLGANRRVLIQSPLTTTSTTDHYGLYKVVSPGSSGSKWKLQRYQGIDEDGDGEVNDFYTGTVAITQGSLRTAVTGTMYEIRYESINKAGLTFKEITDFRKVTTETGGNYVTEDYNAFDQYRTDVGTRNVIGKVTYQISSEAGNNDAPGSFGRMLKLLQGNTATVNRVNQAQLTETKFHESVQTIQLEQELPYINTPIQLTPNREIIIDGSRVNRTREGAVVRSGALRARLGPVSPSASSAARRLVRGAGSEINFEHVNGLEIGPDGKESVIGNLSIGGFSNGSGIAIVGADNVLLNNVRVGVDVAGNPMPNAVGVKIDQAAGSENARFTTVRNSTIAANIEVGISLGTNVDDVRVVGSVIGRNEASNEIGVIVNTGDSGISHLGVRQINPTAAVVGLPVTPLESYPGDIPGAALPNVYDPAPTSRVSVSKNSATDSFEPGLQIFDRTTNRMWTVRKIELSVDELNYVMTVKGPQIDADSFGTPIALEAGYFVDAPQRAETLRLPPGIDPARLYLGQRVTSTATGALETGTFITSITILPPPDALPQDAGQVGHYGGVEIGLSRPVALTAQTGLLFEPPGRNVVGFNNDGIVLRSGSSSIISTDVTSSNFDGIRIEGVAANGKHIIGGAKGIELSSESVTISANLASGLSFTDSFFAGLADGETPQARFDQVKIRGNVFGTDLASTPSLSNGRDGRSNIVIADASLEREHQGKEDRDSATGRYRARYRPEDNPDQLEELEEFEGFDTEGNNFFTGDPLTIIGSGGGGFDGGDGDEDGWWNNFPDRRYQDPLG